MSIIIRQRIGRRILGLASDDCQQQQTCDSQGQNCPVRECALPLRHVRVLHVLPAACLNTSTPAIVLADAAVSRSAAAAAPRVTVALREAALRCLLPRCAILCSQAIKIDRKMLSVVANTEPKQVYGGKQSFVSERTIKDIIMNAVLGGMLPCLYACLRCLDIPVASVPSLNTSRASSISHRLLCAFC
jgi:hypothetical protein